MMTLPATLGSKLDSVGNAILRPTCKAPISIPIVQIAIAVWEKK